MSNQAPSAHLSDRPSPEDYLDFTPYRRTLSSLIADPATDTPFTIGVFGNWGTGKTTLLRMVMDDLSEEHVTLWFNAWKYDKEDVLWRALLLRVVAAVRESIPDDDEEAQQELDDLEEVLYQAIERQEAGKLEIDWLDLIKGGVETGAQVALATVPGLNLALKVIEDIGGEAGKTGPGRILKALKRAQTEIRIAQVQSLEQFEQRFAQLVADYVAPRRLVVFVDDLDRCLPQKAIEVLEAIKLFLDVPGCAFVLGIDRDVIARGIRVKYRDLAGEIEGTRYLEKIIQLPFELPPLESQDVVGYVHALAPSLPDPRCEEVFASGSTEPNPRQIKRIINAYLFLSRLASARAGRLGELNDVRLAKVIVIQHGYPELYALLRREPRLLAELETYYRSVRDRESERLPGDEQSRPTLPERLQPFANSESLRHLLLLHQAGDDTCFAEMKPLDIRPYFTLVRGVSIAPPESSPRAVFEPETVPVPAGEFLRGTSDEEIAWLVANTDWAQDRLDNGSFVDEQPQRGVFLSEYEIGRYPVTNLEYQAFVQRTGYEPPRHWRGSQAPDDVSDHPVVNVSWEDAHAYCEWLSEETGRSYRLPAEAEWEKAARGTDGPQYPWGNPFEPARCNTVEGGPSSTTPVGQYSPDGDSPYGCADMAGNVWEWCQDWYEADYYKGAPQRNPPGPDNGKIRVVRGGSWYRNQRFARCAFRFRFNPTLLNNNIGFRVVVAPPISQE